MERKLNDYAYDNVHELEPNTYDNKSVALLLKSDGDHNEQGIHGYDILKDYVNGLFLQYDDQLRGSCNEECDGVDDERLW